MKRSDINRILESAKNFFDEYRFRLPPWAFWNPEEWQKRGDEIDEIFTNKLGWDVTDFGSSTFMKRGLFLFTLRNGNPSRDTKPYAEKIMIVKEGQETPMHFHRKKMEDIINRGGGKLIIQFNKSTKEENLSDDALKLSVDGIQRRLPAGGKLVLEPGESVCIQPYLYHRFWAEEGPVLTGEVSLINDDLTDNRFLEPIGRFPEIEEDEAPLHLLVSDYKSIPRTGT